MRDEQAKQEYLATYEAWLSHLDRVHKVLLEGERLDPPQLKGLLNREARAKLRYDAARRRLLGITEESEEPEDGEDDA